MLNSKKSFLLSGKKFLFSILIFFSFSIICHTQWVQVNNGLPTPPVYSLAVNGNVLFAGTYLYGIYESANNGSNWSQSSLQSRTVNNIVVSGNSIYAGTRTYGAYMSSNNGTNWTQIFFYQSVVSIAVIGNTILVGAPSSAYLSTNNGSNWSQNTINRYVTSFAVSGNNIFAGTLRYGVFISTDLGSTWIRTSLGNLEVDAIALNGNNIYAGTRGQGVYLSTNNGTTWNQTSFNTQRIYSLTVTESNVFAGTIDSGVYVSTNNGTNWTQNNEGLGNFWIHDLSIMNNYIFAATEEGGVYRRPLNELTGTTSVSNEIPKQFSLTQNYPNPFNPSTNIKFAISKSSAVTLIVYDMTGREVETLLNEHINAGTFNVDWNASNYSSGVYFYKLSADDFNETRKMVLVK